MTTDVISGDNKTVITKGNDHGHYGHRGLEGKDAAFLSGNYVAAAAHAEGAYGVRTTYDMGCQNLVATKDAELRLQLEQSRSESRTAERIKEDGQRTRDVIREQEVSRLRDEVAFLRAHQKV